MAADAPAPRSPAPNIDPVFTWPTPNVNDLIFFVEKNGDSPANKEWKYGDAWRGRQQFPNHKLVYVSPQTTDKWSRWYYAAELDAQDQYNWEHTVADIGGSKFSAVARTYVFLRSKYDPLKPAMGSVMPSIPDKMFSEEFILAYRKEIRSGDQTTDSLFIAEQRVFVKRVTITDIGVRERTGRAEQVITTLYYRGEVVYDDKKIEDIVADKDDAYWGAQSDGTFRSEQQLSENWFSVSLRVFIDLESRFLNSASKLRPAEFFCPQATSTTTAITITTPGDPGIPTPSTGQEIQYDKTGSVLATTTTTQSGSPATLSGTEFDERTGQTLTTTREVVPMSEVTTSTIGSDGRLVTFSPINACWASKITQGVVATDSRTFYDVVNHEWPPVLKSITLTEWTARNGRGSVIYPDYIVKRGFSGPQVATVVQWWQSTPYSPSPPIQMIPEGMDFQSPLFSIRIPPCLHGETTFYCNIGTTDPEWESQYYSRTFDATNYVDWPDSITWTEVRPYRGGYLVSEYTLNKPR